VDLRKGGRGVRGDPDLLEIAVLSVTGRGGKGGKGKGRNHKNRHLAEDKKIRGKKSNVKNGRNGEKIGPYIRKNGARD